MLNTLLKKDKRLTLDTGTPGKGMWRDTLRHEYWSPRFMQDPRNQNKFEWIPSATKPNVLEPYIGGVKLVYETV